MGPPLLPGELGTEVLPGAVLELEAAGGRVENAPGLVVVASTHEGHLVAGEEGRASPHRERKRRERAIRLAHLVKISRLIFSKQCFRKT